MAIETRASSASRPDSVTLRSPPVRDRLATLFPDPAASAPPWWQRRRRAIAAVVVVALIASGLLAARAFGSAAPGYRTATVGTHRVDAQLNGVATIEPVSQAAVAFPTGGTVASVNVHVGDAVAIGQTLASLDPAKLTQTLHTMQATLTQAQLTLEKALKGQAVSQPGTGSSSGSNPVSLTASVVPNAGNHSVADAQQAVLAAQKGVDAALHAATNALDGATTICAAAGVGTNPSTTATSNALAACQTATKDVLTAQTAVSVAQQQLAAASTALDARLGQLAQAPAPSTGSGSGSSANGTPSRSSSGSGATGPSNSTAASSPSAADLVAYQKDVDAAAAEVAVAQQAIAQATIVSPIAGTVQAVNLRPGATVQSASTTATVVVAGAGGYEATTTVSVDHISDVKVGQQATLLPDGSKRAIDGTVSSVSIVPAAGAATTSYRVVIGLGDRGAGLGNGSTGSIAIVTKSARAALAVPTSAVTTIGSRHTVTVLDGTSTTRVLVQVGVVGTTWTEITSGVTAGQRVVLAAIAAPLPGSATQAPSSTTNGPGRGRFQGGFFQGGAPGGSRPAG